MIDKGEFWYLLRVYLCENRYLGKNIKKILGTGYLIIDN